MDQETYEEYRIDPQGRKLYPFKIRSAIGDAPMEERIVWAFDLDDAFSRATPSRQERERVEEAQRKAQGPKLVR